MRRLESRSEGSGFNDGESDAEGFEFALQGFAEAFDHKFCGAVAQ